jgi:predicted phosphodiesterase
MAHTLSRRLLLSLAAAVAVAAPNVGCGWFSVTGKHQSVRGGDLSLGDAPEIAFDREIAARCGAGGLSPHGKEIIRRRPYIQAVSHHSALVLLTADTLSPMWLRSWRPSTPNQRTFIRFAIDRAARGTAPQQEAQLSDLPAGQLVCYDVVDDEGVIAEATGFRTAPPAESGRTVRFAILGDLGTLTSDKLAVAEQMARVPIEMAVVAGDVTYESGRLSDYESYFFPVYARLLASVPFFVAPGNHDYEANGGKSFRQVFELPDNGTRAGKERWYSIDWGAVHLVVLDSETVTAAQLRWLEQDLAETTLPWTIVVTHRPAYSSGQHGGDPTTLRNFVPLFEKYKVTMVLSGHEHHYERTKPQGGVVYVVTGGGGRGVRPVGHSHFTAYSESVAHFTYLEASRSELRFFAIDATGAVFDTARLTR